MDVNEINEINQFKKSSEKHLFLTLDPEKHSEIREIIKVYTKPRLIARTKYVASRVEIKCRECEEWNDIKNSESEYPGYMCLPGDYSVRCKKCRERIYFCNEYDSLAEYKESGDLRCLSYKPTPELVIIKEPFVYPREDYNKSYRKWNRSRK